MDDPPRLQFGGAERIAARRDSPVTSWTRTARSQRRAAAAWAAGHFDREVVPVPVPGGPPWPSTKGCAPPPRKGWPRCAPQSTAACTPPRHHLACLRRRRSGAVDVGRPARALGLPARAR
ncbi:hypothetical protein [Micromonospora sp. b486]|uniref:hypothetical protein n=1 Tax=Micromonospora sp. b486 TaxID=3053986 RepID=UPI00259C9CB6|nr:hypothetical protein [Micromonospora sp. b486]MDM4784432.1 hypothetical protein [Micromonospora sp. b486]